MTNPIFAHTRHSYDSYTDYRRLVELSGFETCYVDEIDANDPTKCYIVSPANGEWDHGWKEAKARIIFWDLEWRLDGAYPQIPGVSEVWASDKWYADKIGARYVVLGSHRDLNFTPDETAPHEYDFIMLSYFTDRRRRVRDRLLEQGYKMAPNGWGLERHNALQRSAIMLHVHQLDTAFTIAPQRWALASAYRMPLVTECIDEPGVFGHGHYMQAEHQFLPDLVRIWRNDYRRLRDYGDALYEFLCVQHTFRREVETAL